MKNFFAPKQLLASGLFVSWCGVFALALTACEYTSAPSSVMKDKDIIKVCIGGVAYFRMGHGITPYYKPDGTLHLCVDTDKGVVIK